MSLDIKEGDYLVVGTVEYPIRSCAEWPWKFTYALKRKLTVTASTKRQPSITSGKRGVPTTNLTGVKCTPVAPLDPELKKRMDIQTPHELLITFADGGTTQYKLVLEDLKR